MEGIASVEPEAIEKGVSTRRLRASRQIRTEGGRTASKRRQKLEAQVDATPCADFLATALTALGRSKDPSRSRFRKLQLPLLSLAPTTTPGWITYQAGPLLHLSTASHLSPAAPPPPSRPDERNLRRSAFFQILFCQHARESNAATATSSRVEQRHLLRQYASAGSHWRLAPLAVLGRRTFW
jgi:hypothetical protein